jgi:phage FluMu gp28-like protein
VNKPYFLPYQRQWIRDEAPKKIAVKSRRIGITHAQAYEDVRDCVKGRARKVWFSSADESAAKEYIDDCAMFARMFNVGAELAGEVILDEDKGVKALQIDLAGGAKIHALTSNPKRFRSKGGKVILDEFAFHENPDELYKAAKPAVTWGWPLRIISTHNGVDSYYNRHFVEPISRGELKSWSLHQTDIWQAVGEGLLDKIRGQATTAEERDDWIAGLSEDMSEEDFMEEYGCIPQAEKAAFLEYELLAGVESDNVLWGGMNDDRLPEATDGLLYCGVDIGRRKDLTVKWVGEQIGGMLFTRMVLVEKNMRFALQRQNLYKILSHPNLRRCCIDESGLGMQLAEEAQEQFGKMRVEPVSFTNAAKEELAYGLRARLEDRTLMIPDDRDVRADLHSVRKSVTGAGNIRFAQQPGSRSEGHADRFWAAALCCMAARNYGGPPSVASRRERRSTGLMKGF